MNDAFEILAVLLDQSEPEVEGHSMEQPPESVRTKLREFALGLLPPAERAELISELKQNRHWVSALADEVKTLRTSQSAASPQII